MTRQKKEIVKRMEEIENFILADEELGCGFAPAGFYIPLYKEIEALAEELAHLRGFKDQQEMLEYEIKKCPPAYLAYI